MPNCEKCGKRIRFLKVKSDGLCDDCYGIEFDKQQRKISPEDEAYLKSLSPETGTDTPPETNSIWPLNFIKWCGYIFLFVLPFIGMFPDRGRLFGIYLIAGIGCGLTGAFFHALSYIVTSLGDIRDSLKNSD